MLHPPLADSFSFSHHDRDVTTPATTTPAELEKGSREIGVLFVVAMAGVMWLAEIWDQLFDANLDRFGIEPREVSGLDGVVLSPFLHGDFSHLIGNTLPFLILGAVIAISGAARVALATLIIVVIGGLGTWLIGPDNSIHIGASGVVFGYATYLMARGFYSRNVLHLLVGIGVVVVYGTTLLIGLVPTPGVSWQGHLMGGVGGVVAARILDAKRERAARKPAPKSEDPLAELLRAP
jgi:membrane associated rhomboid family serine protease